MSLSNRARGMNSDRLFASLHLRGCGVAAFGLAAAMLGSSLGGGPASAQAPEPVPAERPRVASPAECEGKAALYTAGKIQVWVTRKGSMREDNPLRPLSPETLTVLQVAVNGRLASAVGRNFDQMRQGDAPNRLQEASGYPIVWDENAQSFPTSFRVVAEDGRLRLGPLVFQSCGDAPAAVAEKPRPPRATSRSAGEGRRGDSGGNRPGLPQGAIPSNGSGGLSLPQP